MVADAVTTTGSFREKLESLNFVGGRQESQAKTDENGHTVTEHADGSMDVAINVTEAVRLSTSTHEG